MDKSNITLVSAFALACVAGKGIAQNTQATQRPNILYIMCDDHAIQAISAYGSPISKLAPTPNIDRLARRGMIFNSALWRILFLLPVALASLLGCTVTKMASASCWRASIPRRCSLRNCFRNRAIRPVLLENGI